MQVLSRTDEGGWELFDLDDVDTAFNNMAALRFLERRPMEGKCKGITISPVCAGHTLGGAVWRIHACGEEIVYAVDYNHRRERSTPTPPPPFPFPLAVRPHPYVVPSRPPCAPCLSFRLLNGAALEGSLDRPAVLITDAYNYAGTPFDRRARDNKLIGGTLPPRLCRTAASPLSDSLPFAPLQVSSWQLSGGMAMCCCL